ncbi:MAG: hypothetical protein OXB97_06425 [Rhodospirillales bacterium]|nr:hypothetical protein [Rhodospirillales bacterium]
MAVQVRIADDRLLMDGGGIRLHHDWGLELPVEIARLTDLWAVRSLRRGGVGGRR